MATFLLLLTSATLYLDISRYYNPKIKDLIQRIFSNILREEEKGEKIALSGSSFMAMGFLISCLFFPKWLTITSWLILIVSDCLAALVGIKFGKPLSNGKSIAGFVAFFASSLLISIISYLLIDYQITFLSMIISCLLTSLIEFYSKAIRINDNLSIPLTYAFSTVVLVYFLNISL
jgi:dolichol kinase